MSNVNDKRTFVINNAMVSVKIDNIIRFFQGWIDIESDGAMWVF